MPEKNQPQLTAHGEQVRDMFDTIAPRYNLMNTLMTFGQDRRWRRFITRLIAPEPGLVMVDLATGTGDLAFDTIEAEPGTRITGIDFSPEMIEIAKRRDRDRDSLIDFQVGDALNLRIEDDSCDLVTEGYLLRNVDNIPRALSEQIRILKPGGRVIVLETTPPRGILKPFIGLYLKTVIPLLGRLVVRNKAAYNYLQSTSRHFSSAEELAELMRQAGFVSVRWRRFLFGTVAVHWARKPV